MLYTDPSRQIVVGLFPVALSLVEAFFRDHRPPKLEFAILRGIIIDVPQMRSRVASRPETARGHRQRTAPAFAGDALRHLGKSLDLSRQELVLFVR